MYENNNVSIDWKGLFLKIIIIALIVFAIFKGYEWLSNRNTSGNYSISNGNASQLFNANLESLRQAGENYYNYTNYPKEGQTVMVTLAELTTKGNIKELYDANGNLCNEENSYVSLTNDGGKYKLKASLSCGGTSNYTVVQIGCDCEEENICSQFNDDKKEDNNSSNIKDTTKKTTKKTTTKAPKTTTEKTTTSTTKAPTTTTEKTTTSTTTKKTTTKKEYKVVFDSNGGTKVDTQYVEKYDTAYEPEEPEKDDARFVGWYYNGKLWDFDKEITKNIKLEAYYWETKTKTTKVYSAAWDTIGTTYVSVTHKLAIPTALQSSNVKNVRIKSIKNVRTMNTATDITNYRNNHSTTFDGYINRGWDYYYSKTSNLASLSSIKVAKENSYKYDRWIKWTAKSNQYNQCSETFTINGEQNKCIYGIVYSVVWEYDILTD